jgi:GT2 family glycosyltransferase
MKKISASLVVFNPDIPRVIETLNSAFQDISELEIVIVDNSLIKNNLESHLLKLDYSKNLKYFWNGKNIGFGAAHNWAVQKSTLSRFHLFLNPDITINAGCLSKITSFLENHEDIGLVGPKILNPDGTLQFSCRRNPTLLVLVIRWLLKRSWIEKYKFLRDYNALYEMQDKSYSEPFSPHFLSGCFMVVRRDIFEKIGGFDERYFLYFEDADLTRRINQISKVLYYPEVSVIHDWKRGSHKNLKLAFIMILSAITYFKKWGFKLYNW